MKDVVAVAGRAELVRFVHLGLCREDRLDPAGHGLAETPLTRRGRPCGAVFHLAGARRGPSAVWAADEGRVVFYDAAGGRVRATRVEMTSDPPVPRQ